MLDSFWDNNRVRSISPTLFEVGLKFSEWVHLGIAMCRVPSCGHYDLLNLTADLFLEQL